MASFIKIIISKNNGFEFFIIELINEVPALPHWCTVEIVNHRISTGRTVGRTDGRPGGRPVGLTDGRVDGRSG